MTKKLPTNRTLLAVLVLAALLAASPAPTRAQAPPQSFSIIGDIQTFTLDRPGDVLSSAHMTVNGITVTIPRNTIVVMPGTFLTPAEIFDGGAESGLALSDVHRPISAYQAALDGNIVNGQYIAALVHISQQIGGTNTGIINFVDYATGELRVGGVLGNGTTGTRVRINDPVGRFGRVWSNDPRFTSDTDNPTIHATSGYPMCVPRFDPAVTPDPECPMTNRPRDPATGAFLKSFVMDPPGTVGALTDPTKQAPFVPGDYVIYAGVLAIDAGGQFIAATHIEAFLGIYTAPGTQPVYVNIETSLIGTGPSPLPLAQEFKSGAKVEGFSTDLTLPVDVFSIAVDPCTGAETLDLLGSATPLPGARGRWRFTTLSSVPPATPIFPTREIVAIARLGTTTAANGLVAGQYRVPVDEYIFPENGTAGDPLVPLNIGNFQFLTKGYGPWRGDPANVVTQLFPFPGAPAPTPSGCQTTPPAIAPPPATLPPINMHVNACPVPPPPPTPTLTSLSPANTIAGGPAFTLTVNGINFMTNASVWWNGAPRPTTFVNTGQLAAAITAADVAAAGTASVTAINPGGTTSNALTYTINPPPPTSPPTLTSLAPATAAAGGAAFTLTVNGTNFVSGATVRWNGSPRTTTFVSATQLTAAITAADVQFGGTASVTAVNPGGTPSNALTFTITGPTVTLVITGNPATPPYAIEAQVANMPAGTLRVEFTVDGALFRTEKQPKYCIFGGDSACTLGRIGVGAGTHTVLARVFTTLGTTVLAQTQITVVQGP